MPVFPQFTKCEALRCEAPRVPGSAHCEAHGGKPRLSATRLESNRAYKTRLWESIRTGQLSRVPLCQACTLENRVTLAVHVDHVFPWRIIGGQSFARNLFQSLCAGHHSLKTASEARGQFIYYRSNGAQTLTAHDYPAAMRGELT